ncbi:hypothetical protein FOXB_04818 [Fusarium oxysporum f. sp. conglutinans Fo5176]|uniref:Uncharacterized protein n=1 Tax=Fusarium oxysporum (strain Fo5176) TaxID=660025 RepID=F9FEJ0_FUSOF|nr:hypothetical protein FOXB_04818 [Fusarium oxysporum f. sp. conglutinans Fo5176]
MESTQPLDFPIPVFYHIYFGLRTPRIPEYKLEWVWLPVPSNLVTRSALLCSVPRGTRNIRIFEGETAL